MMFWLFNDDKAWFQPKSFGYGAGLPIAWQGWVLLGSHIALIIGLTVALGDRPLALLAAVLPAALLPLPIYAARTEGGMRWRWGRGK